MSAEEARRQALMKLGGLTQAEEEYRRRRGLTVLEDLAGRMTTASFFRALGSTPFKGTDFPAAEDRVGVRC